MTDSKTDRAPVPGVPDESTKKKVDDSPKPEPEESSEKLPKEDPAASGPGFDDTSEGGS